MVGKIYGQERDGDSFSCSGTVVAINIVLTAGHCIYGYDESRGVRDWHFNYEFIPSKWGDSEPYGRFTARQQTVWPYWQHTDFMPLDYGFLVMNQNVGSVVGYAGIVTQAIGDYWSLGYPGTGWYSQWGGVYPYWVYSPYSAYGTYFIGSNAWYDIGMGNYMTGGSSGGPWFFHYNNSWNYVASLNSHCWPSGCNVGNDTNVYSRNMWGPYFNQSTIDLFNYAKTL
jgi:hypothetical protein